MDKKRRKYVEKIEDLNQQRAIIDDDLRSLKQRRKELSDKKYDRLKKKYERKKEKIKQKIRKYEEKIC
ncbi:MAG: hypothetical protein KGY55_01015 [Candidatus Thermoplasmatota archaeon]|nr:hypothetical protein [Candidatus Thermoplasmatota archaeon]